MSENKKPKVFQGYLDWQSGRLTLSSDRGRNESVFLTECDFNGRVEVLPLPDDVKEAAIDYADRAKFSRADEALHDAFLSGAEYMSVKRDAEIEELNKMESSKRVYGDWEPLARKHGFTTFAGRNGFMDGYAVAEKKANKEITRLNSRIEKLREALDYYADPGTWELTEGHDLGTVREHIIKDDLEIGDEPTPWGAKGTWIGGKHARKAIAEDDKLKEQNI